MRYVQAAIVYSQNVAGRFESHNTYIVNLADALERDLKPLSGSDVNVALALEHVPNDERPLPIDGRAGSRCAFFIDTRLPYADWAEFRELPRVLFAITVNITLFVVRVTADVQTVIGRLGLSIVETRSGYGYANADAEDERRVMEKGWWLTLQGAYPI